jgi:hypothetical protein
MNATFAYKTVVLGHSGYINNVHCVSDGLEVLFDTAKSYEAAKASWTGAKDVVFITTGIDCSKANPGQQTYWFASAVTFSDADRTVHVTAEELSLNELYKDVVMAWGTWVPSATSQSIPRSCGLPPKADVNGLSTAPCGLQFDQILDDALG